MLSEFLSWAYVLPVLYQLVYKFIASGSFVYFILLTIICSQLSMLVVRKGFWFWGRDNKFCKICHSKCILRFIVCKQDLNLVISSRSLVKNIKYFISTFCLFQHHYLVHLSTTLFVMDLFFH